MQPVQTAISKAAYILRTVPDEAGDDGHLSYAEMVSVVAHNSAICVEDVLRILP
jgi:adenosylhomocysteine nucleosidase